MSWLDAGIVTIGSQCASHVRISITECDPVERWISGRHGSRCRALARNLWHLVPHGELHRLASDIDRLHRDLAGRIEFQPLEPYLELTLVGDGRGHIFIRGKANDLSSTSIASRSAFTSIRPNCQLSPERCEPRTPPESAHTTDASINDRSNS